MTITWESTLLQVTERLNTPEDPWVIPFTAIRSYDPKQDLDKLAENAPPFVAVFPGTDHASVPYTRRMNRVTLPVAVGVGRKVTAKNPADNLDELLQLSQDIRMYLTNAKYDGGNTGDVRIITPYDPIKYREIALFQSFIIVNIHGYEPVQ